MPRLNLSLPPCQRPAGLHGSHGYTLMELLVVLGILGLLASMAMPLAQITQQREKERELKRALWEIRDAIDAYKRAKDQGAIAPTTETQSVYPPTLMALTQAWPDARAGHHGEVLRFLRHIPRDPFADASLAPQSTWGLRSFASEANRPRPGVDVYDVYSTSEAVGLNGVALKDW